MESIIDNPFIKEDKESAKVKKIIVVRHAESVANTEGIYQGQTYDTDLSELGKKQAGSLGFRLKDFGIEKIISSPLKRTYQTAFAVSSYCGQKIEINNFIIETDHGEWEGKHKDLIKDRYPEIYDIWLKNPSRAVFPNGEAFTDTAARVQEFLDSSEFYDNTLLVTHDNIVRILVVLANGQSLDEIWKQNIEPAALNFFEINRMDGKNKLKVLKLNDNQHLNRIATDLSKHAL